MEKQNRSLLLTVREAQDELRISRATLYSLINKGLIRSIKLGRSRRFKRSEIEALCERGAV
ncbi:helix-turn-helix domain-containing protein [Bosea sp. (in: a-proteobacteria)]|uniref:helix-turn-helix domain-containing protein n=1 Tax=Bosea sp. (in: a-proteobacteria) TaxID=1871050 RepID=UPI001AC1DECC|nr:helix-turn-helix domain-containing protein [Bosea sp. (in: a-proteobacteria)]MBN9439358.1 helix-turn-helix domain-containing protein [Bosea sp. (in: a-proteobacteria)]